MTTERDAKVASPTDFGPPAGWTRGQRRWALAMIGASATLNLVDRQVVSMLIEPIKHEFKLSDTELGFLSGAAFAVCYALVAFPMARLLDRGVRRTIFAACIALWSLCTVLAGFAGSFAMLLLARIGVAVGESSASPAQNSLVADLYPGPRMPLAIAIVFACSALGVAVSMFVGGWLSQHYGWRAAFIGVGAPGILLALSMVLFMPEPPRRTRLGAASVEVPPPFMDTLRYLWSLVSFRWMLLGTAGSTFTGFGLLAWGPSYLIRVFGLTPVQIGVWYGIATALGYGAGSLLSGQVSTVLARRSSKAPLLFAASACLLAVPFYLGVAYSPTAALAIACMFFFMFLGSMFNPPVSTAFLSLAQPRMRGTAAAVTTFVGTIGGVGLGPLALGILSDAFQADVAGDGMRISLALTSVGIITAGISFALAYRYIDRDYALAAEKEADAARSAHAI